MYVSKKNNESKMKRTDQNRKEKKVKKMLRKSEA